MDEDDENENFNANDKENDYGVFEAAKCEADDANNNRSNNKHINSDNNSSNVENNHVQAGTDVSPENAVKIRNRDYANLTFTKTIEFRTVNVYESMC